MPPKSFDGWERAGIRRTRLMGFDPQPRRLAPAQTWRNSAQRLARQTQCRATKVALAASSGLRYDVATDPAPGASAAPQRATKRSAFGPFGMARAQGRQRQALNPVALMHVTEVTNCYILWLDIIILLLQLVIPLCGRDLQPPAGLLHARHPRRRQPPARQLNASGKGVWDRRAKMLHVRFDASAFR
jgi:hypothetical protein